MFLTGADTLLEHRVPFSRRRALVRIAGTRTDTVFAWESAPRALRLEARGAPIMVIPAPYVAEPQWAVAAPGVIAVWTPESNQIALRTLDGRSVGGFAGPTDASRVTDDDREAWFEDAVPQVALFAPLRARARELAAFPRTLPTVLGMLADPQGGVWLRRTTSARGEKWEHRSVTGALLGSVRLPAGRRLRAIGPSRMAAIAEVFVHYPLNYHRFAIPAATAAECGERQGRFEDLADKLFELQDSLGLMTWTEIARRAKLRSIGEFEECISRPTPPARIAAGREAGDRMGVDGTPTVLVNAWRLGSAPASPEGLAAILDRVQEGRPPVEHELA